MNDNSLSQQAAKLPYRALDGKLYHCGCLRCYGTGAWCPVKKRNEDSRELQNRQQLRAFMETRNDK